MVCDNASTAAAVALVANVCNVVFVREKIIVVCTNFWGKTGENNLQLKKRYFKNLLK